MEFINAVIGHWPSFMFVFIRTASILISAPIFGIMNVPLQVKMALSMIIALVLTPLVPHVAAPDSIIYMALSIAGEMFIGIAIGFVIRLVFTGVEFAGQIASMQMGIGMASVYDPIHGAQINVLGKFLSVMTLLMFLSVNGHLMIIMTLKKSFDIIPPYGAHFNAPVMENIIVFSRELFLIAVKFAAPVMAILLFTNVALGVMARTVPQLNMFVIGFAITIFVGFVMISVSLPVFEPALTALFDRMWNGVFNLMKVMGNG